MEAEMIINIILAVIAGTFTLLWKRVKNTLQAGLELLFVLVAALEDDKITEEEKKVLIEKGKKFLGAWKN